jgi:hypothetical protein
LVVCEPYAAIAFHLAPPDVAGLGVITSTSPVTRSSQVWMSSGLPGRVMNTTTELLTLPWNRFLSQSSATMPASTTRSMSGFSENET